MRQLKVSNALLGDRKALDAGWERDGYWYFRGVLDLDAITRLRSVYLSVLRQLGVIERGDGAAVYNGASLVSFPQRMEPLVELRPWKPFVREPTIHAFFRRVLGDEPFWIPMVEYRATPPQGVRSRSRADSPHQESFFNPGIPFKICWIPLGEIDEAIGGLALAEGMHNGPCLHDSSQPPLFPIPPSVIAETAWCRATYRPGDIVMFDLNMPHSELANHSYQFFRLSMDIRVMGASGPVPTIGTLSAVDASSIEVRAEDGRTQRFLLEDDTYCRGIDDKKVPAADIHLHLRPGQEVIVATEDGHARAIRPPH